MVYGRERIALRFFRKTVIDWKPLVGNLGDFVDKKGILRGGGRVPRKVLLLLHAN